MRYSAISRRDKFVMVNKSNCPFFAKPNSVFEGSRLPSDTNRVLDPSAGTEDLICESVSAKYSRPFSVNL